MNVSDRDIEWLNDVFPNLFYDADLRRIVGELDFCAYYDKTPNRLKFGDFDPDDEIRRSNFFLCDVFEVEIHLETGATGSNGWPRVYEVGGRYRKIAEKHNVSIEDLHFYSDGNHACCLGIRYSYDEAINIRSFMRELVIPFLYRLSYVDSYGVNAARNELWEEYSHGNKGHKEHILRMIDIGQHNRGEDKPCPCGSGMTYKGCCLYEVRAVLVVVNRILNEMAGGEPDNCAQVPVKPEAGG